MSKRSLTRGGVASNLDLTMDPAARAEAKKDERAAAMVEEAIKRSDERGGDAFKIATSDELASGHVQMDKTRHHEHTDRERGQSFTQPYGIETDPSKPAGWGWVVDRSTADAIEQGYRCPNCLQVVDPDQVVCTWMYGRSSEIRGCGYSWISDSVLGWKEAEKIRSRK